MESEKNASTARTTTRNKSSKYYTSGAAPAIIAKELLQNTLLTALGCMEWQGARWPRGYGRIKIKNEDMLLHRFIYAQVVEKINKADKICHECDNPPCINPRHLFKGTTTDNNRDKVSKYRMTRNGKSQLSFVETVLLIELAAKGVPYAEISNILGCSQQWAAQIARNNGIYRR